MGLWGCLGSAKCPASVKNAKSNGAELASAAFVGTASSPSFLEADSSSEAKHCKAQIAKLDVSFSSQANKLLEMVHGGFEQGSTPVQRLRSGLTHVATACAASFVSLHILPGKNERYGFVFLEKSASEQPANFSVQLFKPGQSNSLAERLYTSDEKAVVWTSTSTETTVKECSYFQHCRGHIGIASVLVSFQSERVGVLSIGFEAKAVALPTEALTDVLMVVAATFGPAIKAAFFTSSKTLLNSLASLCGKGSHFPLTVDMVCHRMLSSLPDMTSLPLPLAQSMTPSSFGFAWYRVALLDKSSEFVTLLESITQVPSLRNQLVLMSAMTDGVGTLTSSPKSELCLRRTVVPLHSTLLKQACATLQQVVVEDVQKLLTREAQVHQDILVRYTCMQVESVVIVPLKAEGCCYGAVLALCNRVVDIERLSRQLTEATDLVAPVMFKALEECRDCPRTQDLRLKGASPESSSGTCLDSSYWTQSSEQLCSGFSTPSKASHPALVRRQGSSTNGGARKDSPPLSSEVCCAEMLASSHSMGLTHTLVLGLTRRLNEQRMSMSCSSVAEQQKAAHNSISQLKLVRVLGKGGFASVFEAKWRELSAAAKIVVDNNSDGKLSLKHAHEIAMLSSLSHPGIIQAYCCITDVLLDDLLQCCSPDSTSMAALKKLSKGPRTVCHVQVIELCDLLCLGSFPQAHCLPRPSAVNKPAPAARKKSSATIDQMRSLALMSASHRPGGACGPNQLLLSLRRLCLTLTEVASSLAYLHRMGVVHCDIKPANLLMKTSPGDVARGFMVKLGDFGLSRMSQEMEDPPSGPHGRRSSGNGSFKVNSCGTLPYVAPEAMQLDATVDSTVDVYSLGIVMWQLFTMQAPYLGLAPQEVVTRVLQRGMRPNFPRSCPAPFKMLAESCWAHRPRERPSCDQVVKRLQVILRLIDDGSIEDECEFTFKIREPKVQYILG